MELAKAFEPADIERRWYPEWEVQNYFAALGQHKSSKEELQQIKEFIANLESKK